MTQLVRQVTEWEHQRRLRIDGYAAALAQLNDALQAVPTNDEAGSRIAQEVRRAADHARGRLRAVFDESNPYVRGAEA